MERSGLSSWRSVKRREPRPRRRSRAIPFAHRRRRFLPGQGTVLRCRIEDGARLQPPASSRIHRDTLEKLRREIEPRPRPSSGGLARRQHAAEGYRLEGPQES
jgi:hypothetical protein